MLPGTHYKDLEYSKRCQLETTKEPRLLHLLHLASEDALAVLVDASA